MNHAQVTIIADSISTVFKRITTFQLRYWRGIHAEVMTHRNLAKNAGSSRARPSAAIIKQVMNDPWGPVEWGINEPGMQASKTLTGVNAAAAEVSWAMSAVDAAESATTLLNLNLHKQIVNRVLEPYTYIDVVLTGTDFNNFFTLRDHPDADPTIRDLAVRMKAAMAAATPKHLAVGEWHMPFITDDDWLIGEGFLLERNGIKPLKDELTNLMLSISVARCARTSYKAFDGNVAPIEKDLELFMKLLGSQPLHASPAEHQATPDLLDDNELWLNKHEHGCLTGWRQFRKTLPNEFVPG